MDMKKLFAFTLMACSVQLAQAQTVFFTTKITATEVLAIPRFEGCIARVEADVTEGGANGCKSGMVSFSCSGATGDDAIGTTMLETAKMAQVLDYEVIIGVRVDKKTTGGACYAERIAVYTPTSEE